MSGSLSGEALALARKVSAGLKEYFGHRADNFVIFDVMEVNALPSFGIRFTVYDYFPLVFTYDRGLYGAAIDYGKSGIGLFRASDDSPAIEDLAAIAAIIDDRVRLRIPDKYLEAFERT